MRCLIVALCLLLTATARAELPSPRLDILFPNGAIAGEQTEVTVTGPDLEGVDTLVFDHPGLQAELVKERTFKIAVAGDVPAGTYDVRLSGRFGVSNPKLFAVARDLQDVLEVEPNNLVAQAQAVTLNSAVSGQSDGNGQDLYRLPLQAGQRISIDCQSARLDTEMDPLLALSTADGRPLASSSDVLGRDPLLDFTAPQDGEYIVEVRDLTYRGGYPYRLLIHNHPQVENVFPRAVQAGQSVQLMAFGANLGAGGQPSPWEIAGQKLDQFAVPYAAPTDLLGIGGYRFVEHPTHYSVLPTAATCTLVGEQFAALGANPQTVLITPLVTSVESEPNDSREQPQAITLPAIVSARFDKPRDADWYEFETPAAGGAFSFEVYSERIAGRADPYMVVHDDQGNRVFELDDFGHRINAFDGHLRDPSGQTNLAGGKKYRVLVQDRYQRGGARYQYVLQIQPAQPDFFVASMHQGNDVRGTTIWQGGANALDIVIHRAAGYAEPITITAENLPPGLHAAPVTIPQDTRGTFVLWADDAAPIWTGPITLKATGKRGEETLVREVRPYHRSYGQVGSRPSRQHVLSIRERAPYALRLEPERVTIQAGEKADVKLQLTRYWPDFRGAVNYQPQQWPGQLQTGNGTIAEGQTEATIPITVQPGTKTGDYTLTLLGQAQVPFNKDPAAKDRPNTLVSIPSRPITVTVVEKAK